MAMGTKQLQFPCPPLVVLGWGQGWDWLEGQH